MSDDITIYLHPFSGELMLTSNEPLKVIINFDIYPNGTGTKEIDITINENEFIFSKDEIETLLKFAKKLL